LKNDLVKLINERDAKLELFKPDHPTMKVIYAGIKSLEEQIAKTSPTITITENVTNPEILDTEMKVRALVAQVEALKASKQKNAEQQQQTMASMSALSKFQYDAAVLKQKMELAQGHVKMLEEKLADLRLRRSAAAQPISILEPAVINPIPVKPKRPLIIGAALLAGLFLGICFALLAEYLDDRVNSPDDARRVLGVPALGYIPRVDKEQQRLLTSADASGTLLESYRVLRSNVRFAAVGEPLHSIMVTSTAPGEGKSVTAANLAVAMALDGKKVILVDADLRRPTVHEKFGIRNSPGLTNVLAGTMPLDQTLQASGVENLQILSSGTPPPNPAELLNSRAMEQVQEMLKERADIVIFDSPPCLSVADAQVLAASVDGLIYVVQLGSTRKSALKHGTELLRQAHARILGVVYNKMQMDGRRNDYYYGYYSAYHKKELPGKNGSNGHKREDSEDWNALPVQNQDTPALDETLRPRLNAPSEKEES
jgi:capsular exopolysaccharide synthesis family protein